MRNHILEAPSSRINMVRNIGCNFVYVSVNIFSMHKEVGSFIKYVRRSTKSKYGRRSFFRGKKVLEVGSKNINGSARHYFWFCSYTGIDLSKGKGVDSISDICTFTSPRQYDVIISCEMLEHCEKWVTALKRMYALLRPGGLLLITCAGPDREEHGTAATTPKESPDTTDYYRNISTNEFRSILPNELFHMYYLAYGRGENDLYFYGIKK